MLHPLRILAPSLILAAALLPDWAAAADPVNLVLDARGRKTVETRSGVLGHNVAGVEWHGTANPATGAIQYHPAFWDIAGQRPDPLWEPALTAFPLRVVRFHPGNTYEWRKGIGPLAQRSPLKPSPRWAQPYRPHPGLDEFVQWTQSLPGRPEISLIASPFLPVADVADMAAYCNAASGPMAALRASHGHPAPYGIAYWELGNETDWENRADLDIFRDDTDEELSERISPQEYVALCLERIAAIRAVDPGARFHAHAQTAPWPNSNPQWREWHREVLRGMGAELDGIVIHPYYDGYHVLHVMSSVDNLIADIRAIQPVNRFGRPLTVVINEHAKWVDPNIIALRPLTWGISGTLSTGDFLLQAMARQEVSIANYWLLTSKGGPWRVINEDRPGYASPAQSVITTGIHHLYRLLNDALLPEFRLLAPITGVTPPTGAYSSYSGGYTLTAGLFSDSCSGARVLVAVNRSEDRAIRIGLKGLDRRVPGAGARTLAPAPAGGSAARTLITAAARTDSNTPETPNAVTLGYDEVPLVQSDGSLWFELPPGSIASWRWQ